MKKDSLTIKVSIADRFYPLDIKPDREEAIRKAAKLINDKLLQLKTTTGGRLEALDCLAMAALQIATAHVELGEQTNAERLTEQLAAVNQELESYLKLG